MDGLRWRIYYDDREPFTDRDGPPELAPGSGVQAIVQWKRATGFEVLNGEHYYTWTGDRWLSMNEHGLWDYLSTPGWKKVLFGRYISDELYNDILRAAKHDPDFPAKAWKGGERGAP